MVDDHFKVFLSAYSSYQSIFFYARYYHISDVIKGPPVPVAGLLAENKNSSYN